MRHDGIALKVPSIRTTLGELHQIAFNHDIRPFHDDPHLQRLIHESLASGLGAFVETGTFKGGSLRWVARRFPKISCYSCDISYPYVMYSRLRVGRNVHISREDSRSFLKRILPSLQTALFWLDAHWGTDWPLREEVRMIESSGIKGVMLIDDFDCGNGFGFDSYKGQPLDLKYLGFDGVWVPSYPPSPTTRGYAAISVGWPMTTEGLKWLGRDESSVPSSGGSIRCP